MVEHFLPGLVANDDGGRFGNGAERVYSHGLVGELRKDRCSAFYQWFSSTGLRRRGRTSGVWLAREMDKDEVGMAALEKTVSSSGTPRALILGARYEARLDLCDF